MTVMTKRFPMAGIAILTILALALSNRPLMEQTTQAQAQAQANCETFPQTGKTVCGKFLQYWQEHGGLAQQGYPISGEFKEASDVDGKTYTVQYFERAVFEYHPENTGSYTVLLSLLGTMRFKARYPQGAPDTDPNVMTGTTQLFPETGKQVSGVFLDYWRAHGGVAQQGYPLTNAFLESPTRTTPPHVVQYFERAIFEYHQENMGSYTALLSLLGAQRFESRYPNGEPAQGGQGDLWATLRTRPLDLPRLSPGSTCAPTPGRQVSPDFGLALGSGPVYPVGFGADGVYHYGGTTQEGGWFYLKVLWIADPSYTGPILVRGGGLDGSGELRFERGPDPTNELDLSVDSSLTGNSAWLNWPTYTRLKSPGCYAYQIDGTTFTRTIVFRADDK